jgi:uncharacterized short protein YbdD (DUF466 family)
MATRLNQNRPLGTTFPPPCRGRDREGVEIPELHDSTPILTFPLQGGRDKRCLRLRIFLRSMWRIIRQLSGDDAYERYLAHHAACHADTAPLSRVEYFRSREQAKWEGVRRCC